MAQHSLPTAEGTVEDLVALNPSIWTTPGHPLYKPSSGLKTDLCSQGLDIAIPAESSHL